MVEGAALEMRYPGLLGSRVRIPLAPRCDVSGLDSRDIADAGISGHRRHLSHDIADAVSIAYMRYFGGDQRAPAPTSPGQSRSFRAVAGGRCSTHGYDPIRRRARRKRQGPCSHDVFPRTLRLCDGQAIDPDDRSCAPRTSVDRGAAPPRRPNPRSCGRTRHRRSPRGRLSRARGGAGRQRRGPLGDREPSSPRRSVFRGPRCVPRGMRSHRTKVGRCHR